MESYLSLSNLITEPANLLPINSTLGKSSLSFQVYTKETDYLCFSFTESYAFMSEMLTMRIRAPIF